MLYLIYDNPLIILADAQKNVKLNPNVISYIIFIIRVLFDKSLYPRSNKSTIVLAFVLDPSLIITYFFLNIPPITVLALVTTMSPKPLFFRQT